MSSQPIWITPSGSLGTVQQGSFYQVPLQATDAVTIDINSIIGNGSTVTIVFYQQPTIIFQPGDSIIVAGVDPSGYNGTFIVTKCTQTQVMYTSNTTGKWISGGTITSVPSNIYYEPIAGALPSGIECTVNGVIRGVPTNIVTVADEAIIVGKNVTSKFAIRAYTTKTIGNTTVTNRLVDRTFTITVASQNFPSWITPAGELAQLWVGQLIQPGIQLEYTDDNPTNIPPSISLVAGSLPPGLSITSTGLISGYVGFPPSSTTPGFSVKNQGFSEYPFDFDVESPSVNYQFTLQVTDGRTSSLRTFSLYVWSTQVFDATTTYITADETYLTASISDLDPPVMLTPSGSIGNAPSDTYFAYQFTARNIAGDAVGFTGNSIPAGLHLNTTTGWLTGYLPTIGLSQQVYNFSVTAYIVETPDLTSDPQYYSLTITGPIAYDVTWVTPSYMGKISNGSISMFTVEATTSANLNIQYRLASGTNSRLPQGLILLSSGNIVGRVSFNAFGLDNGTTTFDTNTTTFDLTYTFTVNAFTTNGYINVYKTFTIDVVRTYNTPYQSLYIQCMPPSNDRQIINSLVNNPTIFTPALLYRPDDSNFGLSKNVIYYHAYGLNAATAETYLTALQLNHYWKNLTLGEIKTAQAVDPITGKVVYEVVYSEIIDNLVNNSDVSVNKEVVLAYPIENQTVDIVYPNSLDNMRNQVIDVVGQESDLLPLWMQSVQSNGNVLGFTPVWVIAYTIPGASGQIQYNIQTQYGTQLNLVDFEADRYELDNSMTVNWDPTTQQWIPSPPESTTFDINYHYDIDIAVAGMGYRVGDQIKIAGTELNGTTPANDILIVVNAVDHTGGIVGVLNSGTANLFAANTAYSALAGVTISGSGTGASWNITVVPGVATEFDYGSVTFNSPADRDTNTDAANRYLMYPKRNILL
jgi:hypothetical protein